MRYRVYGECYDAILMAVRWGWEGREERQGDNCVFDLKNHMMSGRNVHLFVIQLQVSRMSCYAVSLSLSFHSIFVISV